MQLAGLAYFAAVAAVALVDAHEEEREIICPEGYTSVLNRVCVWGADYPMSFEGAQDMCAGNGGYVYEPSFQAEEMAVAAMFAAEFNPWVGVTDAEFEGSYMYAFNGGPIGYHNFGSTPANDTSVNCVYQQGGVWMPDNCNGTHSLLCQTAPLIDGCFYLNSFYEAEGFYFPDVATCASVCAQDEKCRYYEFNQDRHLCWFQRLPYSEFVAQPSGHYFGTDFIAPIEGWKPVPYAIYLDNPKACQESCRNNRQCKTFTWHGNAAMDHPHLCEHNYEELSHRRFVPASPRGVFISGPRECNVPDSCQVDIHGYASDTVWQKFDPPELVG